MTTEERTALQEIMELLPRLKKLLADRPKPTKHKEAEGGKKD